MGGDANRSFNHFPAAADGACLEPGLGGDQPSARRALVLGWRGHLVAGFEFFSVTVVDIRFELGKPVAGLFVVARKAGMAVDSPRLV